MNHSCSRWSLPWCKQQWKSWHFFYSTPPEEALGCRQQAAPLSPSCRVVSWTADAQTLTGSDNAADSLRRIVLYEDWQVAANGSTPARSVARQDVLPWKSLLWQAGGRTWRRSPSQPPSLAMRRNLSWLHNCYESCCGQTDGAQSMTNAIKTMSFVAIATTTTSYVWCE